MFLSGTGEVVDFLLPLFAGAALGASPSAIGVLLAVELAVSLVVRPVAGSLADRVERRNLAAAGALLYAVACAGYALADDLTLAYAAAATSGVGGALMWVALRALVGERLREDSGVFARLVGAEETGGWVVFVPAVFAAGLIGYQGTFVALAACCLVGAGLLVTAPRRVVTERDAEPDAAPGAGPAERGLVRRLSPMLAAVVITMTGEGAVSLLLLLHLQREFQLEPLEVATVFLPGAIAMGALPPYLHRWVTRHGRSRMLAIASTASALFAASLTLAPNPVVVAVCWVLAAVAWAIVLPVQQAVIAEAAGHTHLGRGLGWYESASLAGALIGSLTAGVVYDLGTWTVACLVFAVVIGSGAVIVPAAVRALGVPDLPPPVPLRPEDAVDDGDDAAGDDDEPDGPSDDDVRPPPTQGELLQSFAVHTAALAIALGIAHVVADGGLARIAGTSPSWPDGPFSFDLLADWLRDELRGPGFIALGLRIWAVIWLIDLVETGWKLLRIRRRDG